MVFVDFSSIRENKYPGKIWNDANRENKYPRKKWEKDDDPRILFLTFTYKYNQIQLSQIYYFMILFIGLVVDACCLLFVSSFLWSAKQWPYVMIWLLFFLWIVSVRCVSFLFVGWAAVDDFFKKRPEGNFMFGFDIVNFDYFDISIHQQVISHSSGQLNDDFTCYLQTTLD